MGGGVSCWQTDGLTDLRIRSEELMGIDESLVSEIPLYKWLPPAVSEVDAALGAWPAHQLRGPF